ncbi:MAG: sulfatase [Pseudomonadales bacterium]|nr:sulfatase [Pseudomonadales bacterium]
MTDYLGYRKRSIVFLLTLIGFVLIGNSEARAQNSQPNFIVVMADDLGYGDLGIYGSRLIKTPNLDRLALNGARLDSFYSSANVCTAARGGLLTGRYPIRLDLVSDVARPTNDVHLAAEEITIAEALRPLGYRSALFGKWHLGSRLEWSPTDNGFDEFYGVLHSNDMTPLELYRDEQMIEDPVDQTTLTERYTGEALRFIEENQDNPFFLYIPHSFPHVPLFVSPRFDGRSDAGLYGDVVETIDWSMGAIVDKLEELNLTENTLIVFTSDNGPWFEGSSGIYRNRKGSSWEGGQRVPFIASWPGTIPAGVVSDEPAMNIDIFPTLINLAGGDLPSDRSIDGKDILPLLTGNGGSPHDALFLFNNDRIVGVRSGRWKLVVETRYRAALNSFEHSTYYGPGGLLFDLQTDPSETYSYTREYPEVVQRLREQLLQAREELEAAALPQMWNRL